MKRFDYRLIGIGILVCLCTVAIQSCEEAEKAAQGAKDLSEDFCGPCGDISTGNFSVSGNAQLDGFFQAVGTLQAATASIRGKFNADVLALADLYGLAEGDVTVDASLIDEIIAKIDADVSANVEGGLMINYQPPRCEASVDVAVSAQAKCEVQAGCDVEVDPGHVSVECEGKCSGGCSGSCEGSLSCAVKAPTVNCEGSCEGSCELEAAASCEGTCHGSCDGSCSAQDGEGNCSGQCDGQCGGTCELSAKAECKGTCHGTCYVDQGSAQCTAEAECSGSCSAECSGSCEGDFKPPSASASCDASAECEAQASANANASLECTPPTLDIDFQFAAGVDASAQAEFIARLGEIRARGAAIIQGFARLSALVDGEVDGEVVFEVSPLDQLTASLKAMASADAIAKFDLPEGRIPCVLPAFTASIEAMGSIGTDVEATLSGQAKLFTFFTTG